MEVNMDNNCDCPTYNEVVFPQVNVGINMATFRASDNNRRLKLLHVKKPRNFVFKNASLDSLKSLRKLFEEGYINSIHILLCKSHSKLRRAPHRCVFHVYVVLRCGRLSSARARAGIR